MHKQHVVHRFLSRINHSYFPSHYDHSSVSFRHFLKYLVLKMRMRRERLDAVLGINNEYLYDAFISCTREGAKWAKKYILPKFENQDTGLKFCVAQRDFLVGKTIIDNIMDTISKSRKTILLVDETFMESKWCQEELLLSHHVSFKILVHLAKQFQYVDIEFFQ